ncbi:MAG: hypothetical protein KME27_26535 [Lyngbya sp. HA4199-MV5]|jgi:hypothetical protein|nr:hypothetical protein [Lyngbya sp. HA4199-MV5]
MENAASQLNFSFGIQSEKRSWFELELLCHPYPPYNIKSRFSYRRGCANASKGCYPAYSQPSQEQFYWADTIIQVNWGGKTTIEVKPTQLSNQQVHELVTGRLSNSSVPTFGGVGCEPAPANLN